MLHYGSSNVTMFGVESCQADPLPSHLASSGNTLLQHDHPSLPSVQAFVASPPQMLPGQQVHHHIYQDAEADHYSCDFSFMPGAWTGRTASGRAAQTGQGGSVAHKANALHKVTSRDTRSVHHGSGRPLYGTAEAQAIIWAHQHPQDCRSQRFLLHSPQVLGLHQQSCFLLPQSASAMHSPREKLAASPLIARVRR